MRLHLKLTLLVVAAGGFAAFGVTLVALVHALQREHELLSREGELLAASVAPQATEWFEAQGEGLRASAMLNSSLLRLTRDAAVDRAWVVDAEGRVVACSDPGGACPAGLPEVWVPHEPAGEVLVHLVHPTEHLAGVPVFRDERLVGAVRVSYDASELSATGRRLGLAAAGTALAWVLIAAVASRRLVRRITGPITRLVRATERLGEGEEIHLAVEGDRETRDLVRAFNLLSERLRARRDENEHIIETLEERVEEASTELVRADRLATLGAIAAGLAHEIGNTIHVVSGYANVVHRELSPEDPHRHDVAAIQSEVQRTAHLLKRFLVFARGREAAVELRCCGTLVRETIELLRPTAKEAQVRLEVRLPPEGPYAPLDGELIRQALINLCLNAIQALGPEGGRVRVGAEEEGDALVLVVEDDGPGIPEPLRERVFEPFYTSKETGTGLGLAIVHHAVEAHRGAIRVDAGTLGGARFTLTLPRSGVVRGAAVGDAAA